MIRKIPASLKKKGGNFVLFIQSRRAYRNFVKFFRPDITFREMRTEEQPKSSYFDDSPATPAVLDVTRYIAETGSEVIGFVELVRYPPEYHPYTGLWLFGLWVDWRYRGMGIGEDLTLTIIKRAKQEGADTIHLLVNEKNLPAMLLYQSLGFKKTSILPIDEMLVQEKKVTGTTRIIMRYEVRYN